MLAGTPGARESDHHPERLPGIRVQRPEGAVDALAASLVPTAAITLIVLNLAGVVNWSTREAFCLGVDSPQELPTVIGRMPPHACPVYEVSYEIFPAGGVRVPRPGLCQVVSALLAQLDRARCASGPIPGTTPG